MTAKFTILLALLCGLLSLCSVLAGTSAEGKHFIIVFLSNKIITYPQNPKFHEILNPTYCTPHPNILYYTGLAYLEAKGKEEGVVTLPSGLLYKEIRPGNGEFLFFLLMWAALSIPSDRLTHDVFHVKYLQLVTRTHTYPRTIPPADGKTPTINSPCEW